MSDSVNDVKDALRRGAECLEHMASASRSGDFAVATKLGNSMPIPLAVCVKDLNLSNLKISEGSSSSVYSGTYDGQAVAVKKVHIRKSADLLRFRKELSIVGGLSHDSIIALVAARALPPDYMIVMPLMVTSVEVSYIAIPATLSPYISNRCCT